MTMKIVYCSVREIHVVKEIPFQSLAAAGVDVTHVRSVIVIWASFTLEFFLFM